MPARAALSAIPARHRSAADQHGVQSASAAEAAGSPRALSSCAATNETYRRPEPIDVDGRDQLRRRRNSRRSPPGYRAGEHAAHQHLQAGDVIGGQRQQPGAGAAEPVMGGLRAGDQRARRQQRALRCARRPGCRHHDGDVVVDVANRPAMMLSSGRFRVRRPSGTGNTGGCVRRALPPSRAASTAPKLLTGRRGREGWLFGLLGVARVVERPALGGQACPHPLDVFRASAIRR